MILTWLHKEGNWYMLDKDQCHSDMKLCPHTSLIWHECPMMATDGYEGMWRLTMTNLFLPCGVCDEVIPDGLAALWQLHNWETLDDLHFGAWHGSFYGHLYTSKTLDI